MYMTCVKHFAITIRVRVKNISTKTKNAPTTGNHQPVRALVTPLKAPLLSPVNFSLIHCRCISPKLVEFL